MKKEPRYLEWTQAIKWKGYTLICVHLRKKNILKNVNFYAPAIRRMRKGIKRCPCLSVRPCVIPCVLLCVRPSFKWVLCERNSPYNFIPILLKLYRCFCQGLKMCMTYAYNPQINFCHFFHSLNLVIFWAQLLLKLMDIRYLVSATPPTIFSQSF